ncbi:flagellar hook assembly protein [Glycocaulis alkaliphilus]|uniref:Basal-body rod modification protein FlgD n=1 Tax=Glycocaulis alkaliphilus TaxID=1434191 RepID=A0A3T0EC86_9PROT|nr:flagellar hook capping FlgD N-terminal domain-containing protein [Glycocaulis alkaliphilus]AZU04910.1 flagellar hook assembly protein [Glycocaulis alkaliphilus]GGB66726.1 basal-body rod modification protein FlgD [Glycocaulis alkaliphilus]
MTDLNPIAQAQQAASGVNQTTTVSSAKSLTDNFDTFLTLLTSQLQNQDPLSPMESQEFVSQLVQFSSVEQQIQSTQAIQALLNVQAALAQLSSVDYIGKYALVQTSGSLLSEGRAEWSYQLPQDATSTQLVITNEQGATVGTMSGQTGAGEHRLVWDGKDTDGNTLPDGVYHLEVIAFDADGQRIEDVSVLVGGRVTGVELSEGQAIVEIGGMQVPASRIVRLREVPPDPVEQQPVTDPVDEEEDEPEAVS